MRSLKHPTVERARDVLDGRAGYRLKTSWGHVAVLEGGGHIAELGLHRVPGLNPLWKPAWKTIDPENFSAAKHERLYGPPPDGRLLAGIAGHSLGFDHFGPPSREETLAGLSTHGEAPATKWRRLAASSTGTSLTYGCTLKVAQIAFTRNLCADAASPVIYCEERAQNLSAYDRPISWNEHVTFGPPFLEAGKTFFDMPATRGRVCVAGYSKKNLLEPDADFDWPEAPRKDGGRWNLRTCSEGKFGHYTAQLLNPELEIAFISACNPSRGLLVVYVFRRADFPWVGNWEERNYRPGPPWNGKSYCRGIEFSTTPFAIPRRETVDQGPLFGESTFRWLPAKSQMALRFVILMFAVPEDFRGVSRVTIDRGVATVYEVSDGRRELQANVGNFLAKPASRRKNS